MTTATQNPEVQELLARGLKLPPDERELLAIDLMDSLEPGPSMEAIQQRIADVDSGKSIPMTREESERAIKEKMRELGFEL